MSYKVVEKDGNFFIKEKKTGNLIYLKDTSKSYLCHITRKLNLGSGFEGHTPKFFLYRFRL